jgi:hypothetical protein
VVGTIIMSVSAGSIGGGPCVRLLNDHEYKYTGSDSRLQGSEGIAPDHTLVSLNRRMGQPGTGTHRERVEVFVRVFG